jgi:Tfp pilus assembly protein PilO
MRWLADFRDAGLRSFRAAGWAGVIGIALAAFAVTFDLTGNRALEDEADTLRGQHRSLARTQRQRAAPALSGRERLEAFYGGFPAADGLPDLLLRVHGHALARGVTTDKADYRAAPVSGTPLEQVSLELPVRGAYPEIRGWLADVLEHMPEVALDGLAFRRADIGSPELEARVRFIVFLRRPS